MVRMPVRKLTEIDSNLPLDYMEYLKLRMEFLLQRFHKYPFFPGVQTGYDSITGEEFPPEELLSYAWINGRGACVLARFADYFPAYHDQLKAFALHAIVSLEKQWELNNHHFPFTADLNGREKNAGCPCPVGYKSYGDLHSCLGFLEYGTRNGDEKRIQTAQAIFAETMKALNNGHFITEPDPTPADRILENPWSVALDLANEFVKQLQDPAYLNWGAQIVTYLLDRYYIEEIGAYVEYVTPEGKPYIDGQGRMIVDPGHAIEFCSFALEFARLAKEQKEFPEICARIDKTAPELILWNISKGWNELYPGIYKTIDAKTGHPIDETMPWWILPETMLALILAYESSGDKVFLPRFIEAHNTYFGTYMNEKTNYGPFQNISGKNGKPVDIVPACKFQDPEFHSGKNILTVVEVLKRLQ